MAHIVFDKEQILSSSRVFEKKIPDEKLIIPNKVFQNLRGRNKDKLINAINENIISIGEDCEKIRIPGSRLEEDIYTLSQAINSKKLGIEVFICTENEELKGISLNHGIISISKEMIIEKIDRIITNEKK